MFPIATMAATEHNVTEEDKKQLVELVEELRRSNAVLRAETEMFEHHVSRLDPRDLVRPHAPESLGTVSQMEIGEGRGRKSRARRPSQERSQCLTHEQKYDISLRELDEMRKDLKKLKENSEIVLQNYKATIEEMDIRLAEVKKASYEFDRDIAKALWEKKGVVVSPEKVIRYTEDRMKARETLIEKLHLKNMALCVLMRRLQQQLRHKEETGEALHEVDFQQLKIENRQHLERIDQCNQDLQKLKLQAGNTQQVLNTYKKKLKTMTYESKLLNRDISSREEMLLKMEEESKQVEKERAKAEALNKKLRSQLEDFSAPHVLEYVDAKALHGQLEQSVKTWRRKVEIAEMELKTHTRAWNRLKAKAGAAGTD